MVIGAAGHTGGFMIAELLRRGFAAIAVGRNTAKLAGFAKSGIAIRTAAIDDPGSLDRAFDGAHAVVNCAGPFLDTANAVAAAALRARVPYFDVTAEQASAQSTFERFDTPAREAGIVVIPALGFFGGLGDLLATAAMHDWETADEIRIGIALDSWRPTQGTRITGERNTARRLIIADGKLIPQPLPARETFWSFPEPFGRQEMIEVPLSEIILITRHLRVSHCHNYLNKTPLRDLGNPNTPSPVATDESGRSAQTFLVKAIVRKGAKTRRAIARGRDIYAFTAPLVVEAVQRVLDGRTRGSGALAPGELFDARNFLEALAPKHLQFEIYNN